VVIFPRMDDAVPRGELDAKIAAAEARTETRFAELVGAIRVLGARLDQIAAELAEMRAQHRTDLAEIRTQHRTDLAELKTETKADLAELRTEAKADLAEFRTEVRAGLRSLTTVVIGTGIGAVAVVVGALAYGGSLFGLGITAHDIALSAARQAIEQYRSTVPPAPGMPPR
jgi:ribosomal protein L29